MLRSLSRTTLAPGSASTLTRSFQQAFQPAGRMVSTSTALRSPTTMFDTTKTQVTTTSSPKPLPDPNHLKFGHDFTDHMASVKWNAQSGWGTPEIKPYGPLTLDPSSTIFHYAPSLFEGMKAYKDNEGNVRLFRPDKNMARLQRSAARLALPVPDGEQLTELIKQLLRKDSQWVPNKPGTSLYLRPALIGTDAALGVHAHENALLFVIASPVGPYYETGYKPVALEADPSKVRAWPGGTGEFKLGANYAPGVQPQMEAATRGYQQNLWLYGPEHWLTEVGTMNLFVVLKQADGSIEVVTPPLNGMILPGVTRDSIIELARSHIKGEMNVEGLPEPNQLKINEREINMGEVLEASKQGRLVEVFGAGTAAIVSPVDRLGFKGQDIHIPVGEDGLGPVAKAMLNTIMGIQYGKIAHPWSVVVN